MSHGTECSPPKYLIECLGLELLEINNIFKNVPTFL